MKCGFWCLEPELPGVLYVLKTKQNIRLLRVGSSLCGAAFEFPAASGSLSWLSKSVSGCQEFCIHSFQFLRPLPHSDVWCQDQSHAGNKLCLPPPCPHTPTPRNDHFLGIRKPTSCYGRKQPSSHPFHLCPLRPSADILHDEALGFQQQNLNQKGRRNFSQDKFIVALELRSEQGRGGNHPAFILEFFEMDERSVWWLGWEWRRQVCNFI